MVLLLSILLALTALGGVVWIVITRSLTSVDGLFMTLILLTISGMFVLSVALELKARGWLAFRDKKKVPSEKAPPAADVG
jgi:hypothetical protein